MLTVEIWLRMSMVKGIGAAKSSAIVAHLMNYADTHSDSLAAAGLNPSQCQQFIEANPKYIASALAWLDHPCHHLFIYGHPAYPQQLTHILSAPLLLFVAGNAAIVSQSQVAMVGSRNFSHYGERWAKYFSSELVHYGFVITSGLAVGIDAICHHSALCSQGKTIAVLGSCLENIYPRCHRVLAQRIIEQNGALISEFLTTSLPLAAHFYY